MIVTIPVPPNTPSITIAMQAAMILKSVNIQYSFLLARPEKVVYFLRTAKYQFIIKPRDNSRVKEGSILRIV